MELLETQNLAYRKTVKDIRVLSGDGKNHVEKFPSLLANYWVGVLLLVVWHRILLETADFTFHCYKSVT
jgi:hypothetical protein